MVGMEQDKLVTAYLAQREADVRAALIACRQLISKTYDLYKWPTQAEQVPRIEVDLAMTRMIELKRLETLIEVDLAMTLTLGDTLGPTPLTIQPDGQVSGHIALGPTQ